MGDTQLAASQIMYIYQPSDLHLVGAFHITAPILKPVVATLHAFDSLGSEALAVGGVHAVVCSCASAQDERLLGRLQNHFKDNVRLIVFDPEKQARCKHVAAAVVCTSPEELQGYIKGLIDALRVNTVTSINDQNGVGLTSRQMAILKLLSSGLTQKEIAKELEISPFTVRSHCNSIYLKVGSRDRIALTELAKRI